MNKFLARNLSESLQGKIVFYNRNLEVRIEEETVWLTQKQLSALFAVERSVTTKHLRNIFKSKELREDSVCAIFAHTAGDGKQYKTKYYNLDAIISVGYRVNSKEGTKFRIWATRVLKDYLIEGYVLNEERLKQAEIKYREFRKTIALFENLRDIKELSIETKGIIEILSEYSRALDILDRYDHQNLDKPSGTKKQKHRMTYADAWEVISAIKRQFMGSSLVGQEKDNSFKSSLAAIYQTFHKRDVYPTVEEKAAHLLYFVVKNHSFVDGNKRIAAALFVYFLEKNGLLFLKAGIPRIDDAALVALTIMIASSKPSEKEVMINVILNVLNPGHKA